jgi:urease accessory protein
MYVVDTYVGNEEPDPPAACETVVVGEDERRRSRFRTATEAGTDVGVVVGRELRAGDVLTGDGLTVVVELEPVEALAVDIADTAPLAAVELGHAAGNRHWDVAVRDGRVLFPVAESAARMEAAIDPYLPDGATVRTESVPPSVFDGSDTPGHGHPESGGGGDGPDTQDDRHGHGGDPA